MFQVRICEKSFNVDRKKFQRCFNKFFDNVPKHQKSMTIRTGSKIFDKAILNVFVHLRNYSLHKDQIKLEKKIFESTEKCLDTYLALKWEPLTNEFIEMAIMDYFKNSSISSDQINNLIMSRYGTL